MPRPQTLSITEHQILNSFESNRTRSLKEISEDLKEERPNTFFDAASTVIALRYLLSKQYLLEKNGSYTLNDKKTYKIF